MNLILFVCGTFDDRVYKEVEFLLENFMHEIGLEF